MCIVKDHGGVLLYESRYDRVKNEKDVYFLLFSIEMEPDAAYWSLFNHPQRSLGLEGSIIALAQEP